jgi:hypothetical protein
MDGKVEFKPRTRSSGESQKTSLAPDLNPLWKTILDPQTDASFNLECLLPATHAAALTGLKEATLRRYYHAGMIAGFTPSTGSRRPRLRYKLKDLLAITEARISGTHLYDPRAGGELPVALVARLTGLSEAGVKSAVAAGRLHDRRPESIRVYWLWYRRIAAIRTHKAKLASIRVELRRVKSLNFRTTCSVCHRRLGRPPAVGKNLGAAQPERGN